MFDTEKKWQLELWKNENGFCPVEDFFDELSRRKNVEYRRMKKKLDWFQTFTLAELEEREVLGKVVNAELYELRFNVGIEIRLLGIKRKDETLELFCTVHGFHKKDQKIRKSDIEKASERIKEII